MTRRHVATAIAAVIAAAGIAAGGYWAGRSHLVGAGATLSAVPSAATTADREVLYYRDPMGKSDFSPVPKKDSMGMDYIPVYEDEEASETPPASAEARQHVAVPTPPPKGKGRILYYRNPMGLPDTSAVAKKDPMGMDYIPVYEGEDPAASDDAGTVRISPARVQRLGVRTETASLRDLRRVIRAVGTVQADERRLFVVNTKFDGWIEKLHVNATGQTVKRGQPLMEVYAPELVVAQQEYLLAWRTMQDMAGAGDELKTSARQLADAALRRLRSWDISDDQIRRLQRDANFARTLTVRAPADGIVLEKTAIEGMKFAAGDALYRLADLSTVWLLAEVFEQDLAAIQEGADAKITVGAYPGVEFSGKVAFVYPTVARETRTAKVRIEIPNGDGRLKIDMYSSVELGSPLGIGAVVAVPDAAVLDSGTRQAVLVDRGEGRFEPREVKLGNRAEGYVEVRSGLQAGEDVVVGANFLIDAESNLRAALKAFTPADQR